MRELVTRAKARPSSQRRKPVAVPMAAAHGMVMWAALIDGTAVSVLLCIIVFLMYHY